MFIEPGQHKAHGLPYNPFKALVAPRPIAWVSSLSAEGIVNVAPYSFYNAVADQPPIVYFAPTGPSREDGVKDSQRNAEQTGEFVVNVPTWELREKMNETSAALPPDISEAEVAGLKLAPCEQVKPPRLADSPVSLECRYLQTLEFPAEGNMRGNFVVFGQVVGIHLADWTVNDDGLVEPTRYQPIARLGYMDYTVVERLFAIRRPEGAQKP
ncbi:flavin reductase family protein [Algihabitans albus]|uniref:flavin reductase family protein n=1 Tax=Algihabitans albus TaxID=2164067 RepID=UPI0035CFD2FF